MNCFLISCRRSYIGICYVLTPVFFFKTAALRLQTTAFSVIIPPTTNVTMTSLITATPIITTASKPIAMPLFHRPPGVPQLAPLRPLPPPRPPPLPPHHRLLLPPPIPSLLPLLPLPPTSPLTPAVSIQIGIR